MVRRKFSTPYIIKDGMLIVRHDDSEGSHFGSYPEPTRWLKNIKKVTKGQVPFIYRLILFRYNNLDA